MIGFAHCGPARAGRPRLVDPSGRVIDYLRLSVTDHCDLRCTYCMSARPRFVPRREVLNLEELERLVAVFISLGVRRVRVTGGEPLARAGVLGFLDRLARHLRSGALDELTLTTNGTRLWAASAALAAAGIHRVNVSLDSLDRDVYRRITRGGDLGDVLRGLDAAAAAGLDIKLNVVVLEGENRKEVPALIRWAHARGLELSLIEAMPLGAMVPDHARRFVSLVEVRRALASEFTLVAETRQGWGPARFFRVLETGGHLGFIAPLSECFCATCNRVRVTCTGVLHACIGREDGVDLRAPLRSFTSDGPLVDAILQGVSRKPLGHRFRIGDTGPGIARPMSVTGG
ncbi:MAG TPA: GTP 3',8-cyclase MoaA [Anaeromyxobacter sp.]|nr:GTP 3',8-cyclase MoaA [Anaeromyxobacter sp.]